MRGLRIGIVNRERGFTIVELLIVVVVIAVLASITIVAFNGVQSRARDTARLQDMKVIIKALEAYKTVNGSYPAATPTLNASGWEVSSDGNAATNYIAGVNTAALSSKLPVDPVNTANPAAPTPGRTSSNRIYFYARYSAGSYGCDVTRGAFYVIGVTRMDTVASGQNHPDNPGFSCSGRNWVTEGAWVYGAYTNG